jgi:hypothetical protein
MNEKILNWVSVAIILGLTGLINKYHFINDQQLKIVVFFIIGVGILYRIYVIKFARRAVKERRRMYKELWRREQSNHAPQFTRFEEESVVLLGRIKGGKWTAIFFVIFTIIAIIYHKNLIAFVLSLGQLYLAARLHFIVKEIIKQVPADNARDFPYNIDKQQLVDIYLVEIDIRRVHDFILPTNALPFWDLLETEQWLLYCGFERINKRVWKINREGLRLLDTDEIISIQPI